MSEVVLYHNPRCSKSREALRLLRESGIEPRIVKYLEEPLTKSELQRLYQCLKVPVQELIRDQEPEYQKAGLSTDSNDDAVIDAIAQYPKLLQRPIVVHDERAVIGRPPERILELLR